MIALGFLYLLYHIYLGHVCFPAGTCVFMSIFVKFRILRALIFKILKSLSL